MVCALSRIFLWFVLFSSVNALDPGCSFVNGQCSYIVKLGHAGQCDTTRDSNYPNQPSSNPNKPTGDTGTTACCATAEKHISSLQVDLLNKLVDLKDQILKLETQSNGTTIDADLVKNLMHNSNGESYTQIRNDLTKQSDKLNSLELRLNGLVTTLQHTQETLVHTEKELGDKNSSYQNLLTELKAKEALLKGKTSQLDSYTRQVGDELQRLRSELAKATNELNICRGALHVSTGHGGNTAIPVLYGDIHVTRCSFEHGDHMCNYTQDRQDNGDWTLGHASEDGSLTGPSEDHSFGAPSGHYWYLASKHLAEYSRQGRTETIRMTSAEFPPAQDYCIKFAYSMYGTDTRTLKVYASVNHGLGYPVFSASGNKGTNWQTAEVHLDSEYTHTPFKLVFEGTTNSYKTYSSMNGHYFYYNDKGDIAIDDVYVYNASCKAIPKCPPGAVSRTDKFGNDSCYIFNTSPHTWYTAYESCRTQEFTGHLVTIEDQDEQDFLVGEIKRNADLTTAGNYGFWTSGNDDMSEGHFKWTDTGTPYDVNYTNWKLGQPNNVASDQDCLLLEYPDLNYQWGDVDCDESHPYICEFNH